MTTRLARVCVHLPLFDVAVAGEWREREVAVIDTKIQNCAGINGNYSHYLYSVELNYNYFPSVFTSS